MSTAKQEYSWIREREARNKARYEQGDGTAALPHTICLTVNNNCFMRCKMCDIGATNREQNLDADANMFSEKYGNTGKYAEFPIERLKALVDEVAHDAPIIKTNFVEPMLYSGIEEIARYVKSKGMKYYTITNGWQLKKNAEWVVDAEIDLLRVSLDGSRDMHDGIRGVNGSFDRTVEGLKEIIELKKRNGVEAPVLGICYTISDSNFDHLLDFMDCMEAEGLLQEDVYVNFSHLMFTVPWEAEETIALSDTFAHLKKSSIDSIDFSKLDTAVLADQIRGLKSKYEGKYHYYFTPGLNPDDVGEYYDPDARMFPGTPCYLPWQAAQIDMHGEVNIYGRCILPSFGNIMEQSFEDVWNSPVAQQLRKDLKEAGSYPGCNRCIGTLYPLRGRD